MKSILFISLTVFAIACGTSKRTEFGEGKYEGILNINMPADEAKMSGLNQLFVVGSRFKVEFTKHNFKFEDEEGKGKIEGMWGFEDGGKNKSSVFMKYAYIGVNYDEIYSVESDPERKDGEPDFILKCTANGEFGITLYVK